MNCPCFKREYVGICDAYKFPYIPSSGERVHYCLKKDFETCPIFKKNTEALKSHLQKVTEPAINDLKKPGLL